MLRSVQEGSWRPDPTVRTRSWLASAQARGQRLTRSRTTPRPSANNSGQTMPDRVMLITGASRGIGAATARLAAARGYARGGSTTSRASDAVEAVAADVRAKLGARPSPSRPYIGKPHVIARLFSGHRSESGRLDAFFNNAGSEPAAKLVDIAPARLQQILAVNTTGAFIAAQESRTPTSTRWGRRRRLVVNMSSLPPLPGGAAESTDYAFQGRHRYADRRSCQGARRARAFASQRGQTGPDRNRYSEGFWHWRSRRHGMGIWCHRSAAVRPRKWQRRCCGCARTRRRSHHRCALDVSGGRGPRLAEMPILYSARSCALLGPDCPQHGQMPHHRCVISSARL